MVNLRINWTLSTGAVRNREETPKQKPYQVGVKCLFISLVYHSLRVFQSYTQTNRNQRQMRVWHLTCATSVHIFFGFTINGSGIRPELT